MKNFTTILTVAVALLTLSSTAFASGSSVPRAPRTTKASGSTMDRETYSIGQRIFNGKADLRSAGDAAAQTPRLQVLQGKLPAAVAKKTDLVKHAGKLTDQQLQALEYFVQQRFGK